MTRTLRRYIAQARKLGACEAALLAAELGGTVEMALERLADAEIAWVVAFMDLPPQTMLCIERQVLSQAGIAQFFGQVAGGLFPMPRASRRDALLRRIDDSKRARYILHSDPILPQRWQRKLQKIAQGDDQ